MFLCISLTDATKQVLLEHIAKYISFERLIQISNDKLAILIVLLTLASLYYEVSFFSEIKYRCILYKNESN